MADKLKELLGKAVAWWQKFSSKQRMIITSVVGSLIIAFIILGVVVSKPTMVSLITCESAKEAAEVTKLLNDEGITFKQSGDGLHFEVDSKMEAKAKILLGSNSIPTDGYSIDDVFSGGFNTTEADKEKKYQLYLEQKFENQLETMDPIKSATVSLSIPEKDGTIIAKEKDTFAECILNLSGDLSEEQAEGIARFLAVGVGNKNTDSILIMDSESNVLFSGADSSKTGTGTGTQLSYQMKAEDKVKTEVKEVVLGTNIYDNVEVGLNLVLNFDQQKVVDKNYYVPEGKDQGYLTHSSTYDAENAGGKGGVPGTNSNNGDAPSYLIENGDGSNSTVSETDNTYSPSETVTETQSAVGNIKYDESSISVVAINYIKYDEAILKKNGELKGKTFEEFKQENGERIKKEVDEEVYDMVSKATGFSRDNITVMAYDVPFFKYDDSSKKSVTDYLQIILTLAIFALLGFVVFKSTRKIEKAEPEPELSVEELLETTKNAEMDLDDIDLHEKSETRLLIEKFAEENPEAAASLLRNWLNEEWE